MIELLPVTEKEFPTIMKKAIQGFADECIAAGRWKPTEAHEHARVLIEADLAQGLDTPGHWLFHLIDSQRKNNVGYLWLETTMKDNLPTLFVADIEIKPAFRRQGFAAATFTAIEQFADQQNINRISLHVFRQNTAAQALYKKLGFQVTGLNMLKNRAEKKQAN